MILFRTQKSRLTDISARERDWNNFKELSVNVDRPGNWGGGIGLWTWGQ